MLADPDIPNKVLSGKLEDIRPCIACFYCQNGALKKTGTVACAVNGATGREGEYQIRPTLRQKRKQQRILPVLRNE